VPLDSSAAGRFSEPIENRFIISVWDLCKRFGDLEVLKHVHLDVEQGTSVVILGESGCGKTVLLKCIIGLLEPDCGRVLYEGRDVCAMREREKVEMRKHFGMLFQGGALFDSLSVAENLAFSLQRHTRLSRREIDEIVAEKLELVGLPGIQDKMPAELSGGMKKRVALARAIVMDPEIVLYDEPTTGLDPIMADQINDLMIKMEEALGVTSLVVTHDIASAQKVGSRLVMMYDGRFIFDGTPEEIVTSTDPLVRSFVRGDAHLREEAVRPHDLASQNGTPAHRKTPPATAGIHRVRKTEPRP